MKIFSASLLSTLFLLTAACAHEPAIQELAPASIPSEEVTKLEGELNQGLTEQLDVLAPGNYAKATEALQDAKKGIKSQDDAKDVLHDIAVSKAYLAKARTFGDVSKTQMKEVVETRQLALKEGAQKNFPEDFKDAVCRQRL